MAAGAQSEKLCAVCGADVAGKPRVKNAQGEYLCKGGDCEKTALARAKSPTQARTAPLLADPDQSLMSNLISSSPMLTAKSCPGCSAPVTGNAVVCVRCGYNLQTGKNLKTAIVKEKEAKDPAAPKRRRAGDFGPSFGVLFLLVTAAITGLFGLTGVDVSFLLIAYFLCLIVNIVGGIWGIVDAFRQGETVYGVLGILGYIIGLPGLVFLYYMIFVNELKWSRSLYLGSIVGAILGFLIAFLVIGASAEEFLDKIKAR